MLFVDRRAALTCGPEREKCLAQAARCRRDAKRDADLLKATAADGQHMVHPAQKLRLAFASPLPATVEEGDAFDVEGVVAAVTGLADGLADRLPVPI